MAGSQYNNRGSKPWPPRSSGIALIVALTAVLAGMSRIPGEDGGGREWRMIGHDPSDTRGQPFERIIGTRNVGRLAVKWVATTTGDVSATPAVVDGAVYFGDFGGTLWKLDAEIGEVIWSHRVPDYTGIRGDISRTSPALARDTLVIGDLSAPNMIGVDARTGELRWITQLNPDSHAIITGSPVLAGDTIYVGTSQSGVSTFRCARRA